MENHMDTIERFSNETFHSHFRMGRKAFEELVNLLKPYEEINTTGRPYTNLKEKLYITLWSLSNQNSFREIGDRFNKSKATVYNIMVQTCRNICKLLPQFVKWPTTNDEINNVLQEFNNLRGNESFPNVLGCIDGMHIAITTPSKDPSSYYNRKGFHSLILQAVCNARGIFTNIFFGWPGTGRSHDAWVFKQSTLGKMLESGRMKIPTDVHIIGDSAYPLKSYLMIPYKDNGSLNSSQVNFNNRLKSSRVIIEQAFGILKSKFRILNHVRFKKIMQIKYIVTASVILHNLIILRDEESLNMENPLENIQESLYDEDNFVNLSVEGHTKRETLCNLLCA